MLCNDEGSDALPMRFAAAAILMGMIIAISATALADFSKDTNISHFSGDLSALEARASVIYQQGGARDVSEPGDNTGTKEIVTLTVPNGVEYVVFGAMPSRTGGLPVSTSLHEQNIIYYKTYQGTSRTRPSKAMYAALPRLDGPIVLMPGSYELTLELVKDNDGTYITLY
ncbi:MAG: hypothetical protein M8352_09445 [ANME-2 cluster archaeon]|nr:hypothetical protein [ANME-2 cluster archaeon]MDF1532614.1 hypothetical protein [ANME-2 cluster archaeon]